ncbi:MAG: class I SAM-dependent methyltransferase [Planctomycetota bacterium]
MMIFHKFRQMFRALKWHRQVRQAVSTQLELLEAPSLFALGGLTDEEERALAALVVEAGAQPGPVIEFGTLFGLTTRLIAAAAAPRQRVITVDNFCWNPFGLPPALHEAFARKVLRGELASGRVELIAATSEAFRAAYAGAVPALVFLDADHSYAAVREEIAWARRLGVPLIAGHDYGNQRFGVTRAVDEALGEGIVVYGSLWAWRAPV